MKKLFSIAIACCMSVSVFATGHTVTITATNVSCNGGSDGMATATVSGGVGPFQYLWSPSGVTTQVHTGLVAGTYTVTVTDSNDMSTATASINVYEPTVVTISLPPSFAMCAAGPCVALSAVVMGGTSPYTFNWTPASSLSSPVVYNPVACPTVTTTYTMTTVDANGCVATASTTVNVGLPITLTTTATPETCLGTCDGQATVTAAGGAGVYTYSWTDPGMNTTQSVTGLCSGTYAIIVTDANGCVAADSAVVGAPASPIANFSMVPDSVNVNEFWTFNSSTGGTTYVWDFGDGGSSSDMSPTYYYAAPGVVNVCLYVFNSLGCSDTLCKPVTVTGVLDPCMAMFNIADDTTTSTPNVYTVYNLSYGATLTYLWDFGDTTTSTLANPTHVYSVSSGSYQICLTVDNGSGCTHTYCDYIYSADSLGRSSDPIMFTVVDVAAPVSTGITEKASDVTVNVYPNPFSESTTFEIGVAGNYTVELTDVVGKKVMEVNVGGAKKFEISRAGLENGVYFYTILGAEGAVNKGKLIIK